MNQGDYQAVSEATTREEFRAALSSFAAKMDFPLVNALLVDGAFNSPNLRIGSIGNTPSSFLVMHADLARIRVDPVMRRLQGDPTPFVWDQAFYAKQGMGHLWEDQAPHGYRVGVAASLPVGAAQSVFIGVDRFDKLPSNESQLARLQADLQLLAVHAHVAAKRILAKPANPSLKAMQLPRLSPREVDVLRWTAEGKTALEVDIILGGVKERTINSYLESAKEKLEVVGSKHMAVKVAKALGLI